MWTGGIYGCHNDHKTILCSNVGPFMNHVINICAVVAFYSLILFKMRTSRPENIETQNYSQNMKKISFTLFILTGAYITFLTPILALETCSPWAATTKAATEKGVRAVHEQLQQKQQLKRVLGLLLQAGKIF